MCDYSLELYKSRPAAIGEPLELVTFGTGSKGFTPACPYERSSVAACVRPGTKLLVDNLDENCLVTLNLAPSDRPWKAEMVRAEGPLHRDALKFENGAVCLLQFLNNGVRATVLHDLKRVLPLDAKEQIDRVRDLLDA